MAAMESAVWGGIATGLFAKTSINSVARWDGLVFGNVHLFVAQVLSIIITAAVAVVGTLICIGIIRIFTPLRVDQEGRELLDWISPNMVKMHIRPSTDSTNIICPKFIYPLI